MCVRLSVYVRARLCACVMYTQFVLEQLLPLVNALTIPIITTLTITIAITIIITISITIMISGSHSNGHCLRISRKSNSDQQLSSVVVKADLTTAPRQSSTHGAAPLT